MIALYFAVYYLLALGITRVRAEVGPPTHEMFVANPRHFIIDSLGFAHDSAAEFNDDVALFRV